MTAKDVGISVSVGATPWSGDQGGGALRSSGAGKAPRAGKSICYGMVDPEEDGSSSQSESDGEAGRRKRTRVWHENGFVDLQSFMQASGLDVDQQIALLVAFKAYLLASKPKVKRSRKK